MTTALIDADIVAYRCAATVQDYEDPEIAFYRVDVLMTQILEATSAKEYVAYLTGKDNFRKKINPEYKANRKDMVPPVYLQECKAHIQKNWNTDIKSIYEADDLLGMNQTSESIICSIDKDLLMIPGEHFNWVKMEFQSVTKQDGLRHFYKQMLIGDRSDNITGVAGIGQVKATKIIDPLDTEQDMFEAVFARYDNPSRFIMNANCLWILQQEGQPWTNRQDLTLENQFAQEVAQTSDYMTLLMAGTLTEPITMQNETSGILSNGTSMDTMQTNDQLST